MKRYLCFSIIIGVVLSCAPKKEIVESTVVPITSLERGPLTYLIRQDKTIEDCSFHQSEGDDLVMSIMQNHTGDKDDRLPRRVVNTDGTVIQSTKSDTHSNRLVTKSCFNPAGQIVAMEYDTRDNPEITQVLKTALFEIQFEARDGSACVECMTKYYWVR